MQRSHQSSQPSPPASIPLLAGSTPPPPEDLPPSPAPPSKVERAKLNVMGWLERRSQSYIVVSMALVAVIRGFYLFTDKLVNLAHYPAINIPLSLLTGILLSGASELTITIAGRRHKLYKAQLYNARLALAGATAKQKPIWEVEIERLREQVTANVWAMRISMGMSLLAAASYLIDSTGAVGFLAFFVASALAAYVLYLMYYHGVQTDEIKEDGTAETAQSIREALNVIRIEEIERLRAALASATVNASGRLALIASGLPIPDQRQVMPILKILLRVEEERDVEDATASWLSTRDIARRSGEDLQGRKADDVMRKYRRRLSLNADKHPEHIRLDPVRGWLIEPSLAQTFFAFPALDGLAEASRAVAWAEADVVDADTP